MNKTKKIALIVLLILIVCAAAGLYLYNATYITIDQVRYRRDAAQIDLQFTELSAERYESLRAELPECEILWTPMFQGEAYTTDTAEFTVTSLSEEDLDILAYFPNLCSVDAEGCRDYDQLLALQNRYPDCEVTYSVDISGKEYASSAATAQLHDADMAEVSEKLKYLPGLQSVLFTGRLPGLEEMQELSDVYPSIAVNWEVGIFGMTLASDAAVLDLTGYALESGAEVEAAIPYLPGLETINLCGTGLGDTEIMALAANYPEIEFVWEITIGKTTFRSDAVEIDISGNQMTPDQIEAWLPYLTRVEKIIMCNCGIDNETMDALNRRYEDIKFVWSVYVGSKSVRTDITSFIPFKLYVDYFVQGELYNLRYCTDIVALDLGHQRINTCEFVAFMPNLKYLIIADTQIMDLSPLEGLENLEFLEMFLIYSQDYTPLLSLKNLKDLNLAWTYGDYKIIAQMPWLERCWWGGKWHNQETRDYLTEHCPNTLFEFDDGESTGSGWRDGDLYYEMRDALGMFYMH